MEGNNLDIREVPLRRLKLNEGQCVMDHDMPELVVFYFLKEDHQQFLRDICIDREESTKGTMDIVPSSNSKGLECAFQHPCLMDVMKMEGEVKLDSGDKNSIDHPTKKTTSEALREEAEFSRSFKNWQINSTLGIIGSRVEFPHFSDCPPFSQATRVSRPEMGNSQSLTGSGRWFDQQADYPGETSCAVDPVSGSTSYTAVLATKSGSASQESNNDSISSSYSFRFPILPSEWKGSPVKMVEAHRGQSRKHQRRKICFSCCKY